VELLRDTKELYRPELSPPDSLTSSQSSYLSRIEKVCDLDARQQDKAFGAGILTAVAENDSVSVEVFGRSYCHCENVDGAISRLACMKLMVPNSDGQLVGSIIDLGNAKSMMLIHEDGREEEFGLNAAEPSRAKPLYGVSAVKFADGTVCSIGESCAMSR
jgi:hypothetical protein